MYKLLFHIALLSLIGLHSLYGFDEDFSIMRLSKSKADNNNLTKKSFRFYSTNYLFEKDLIGTWTLYLMGCNQCPNITFTKDNRAIKYRGDIILEVYHWRRANDTLFFVADSSTHIEFNDKFYLMKYTNEDNREILELINNNKQKKYTLIR